MAKSREAFRTISEVAEALDCPAHVLRFWESKFTQIKPVKRAGGRRYYRPDDIALLAGIKMVLHEHGMTIKGAQKLLREKGVKHVAALAGDPLADVDVLADVTPKTPEAPAPKPTSKSAPQPVPMPKVVQRTQPAPAAVSSAVGASTPTPEMPDILALVQLTDAGAARRNADKIAPLLAQLATVRDRMRA